MSIKNVFAAAVAAVTLLVAQPGFAQDAAAKKEPSAKQLAQREKMKNCNAEAKSQTLAGDARKTFMKTCLSGGSAATAETTAAAPAAPAAAGGQKEKMKTCNADAKDKALKGDDRKAFMKTCLTAG